MLCRLRCGFASCPGLRIYRMIVTNLSLRAVFDAGRSADLLKDLRFVRGRNWRAPHTFGDCSSADRWHWSIRSCSSRWTGEPLYHPCVSDDERTPRRLSRDILNAESYRITMSHDSIRPRPNSVASGQQHISLSVPVWHLSETCDTCSYWRRRIVAGLCRLEPNSTTRTPATNTTNEHHQRTKICHIPTSWHVEMLGSGIGIAMWQICCRIVVSLSVGGVRSRCS